MSPFFDHEKDAHAYRDVQLQKLNYNYRDATLEWDGRHEQYYWKPKKKRKAKKAHDQNWGA